LYLTCFFTLDFRCTNSVAQICRLSGGSSWQTSLFNYVSESFVHSGCWYSVYRVLRNAHVQLLYLIASLLFALPLSVARSRPSPDQETSLGSPMRDLHGADERRVQASIQQVLDDLPTDEDAEEAGYKSYSVVVGPESSHVAKPSCSTISSSSSTGDPFSSAMDGANASSRQSIPCILMQDRPATRDASIHTRRPESAASTSVSHITSQISIDSDQIHTATARLMEASFAFKQAGLARLVRMPSNCLALSPPSNETGPPTTTDRSVPTQSLLSPISPPHSFNCPQQNQPSCLDRDEGAHSFLHVNGPEEVLKQEVETDAEGRLSAGRQKSAEQGGR
jgi:hypothetical protein